MILGLQVTRNREVRTLRIAQGAYIKDLIARFKLGEAKPINLLIADRNILIKEVENKPLADQTLYQITIRDLL
jgi:hypothetical protein